ncbi:MAG: hypothetical protein ACYC46_10840 [Acidobacteriaceae bacterium]
MALPFRELNQNFHGPELPPQPAAASLCSATPKDFALLVESSFGFLSKTNVSIDLKTPESSIRYIECLQVFISDTYKAEMIY